MMDYWNDNGTWMNGFGILVMVALWAGLISLVVWAVARMTRKDQVAQPSVESSRQILDRRLAAGEIDAEQYAEARRVLEGRVVDAPTGRR